MKWMDKGEVRGPSSMRGEKFVINNKLIKCRDYIRTSELWHHTIKVYASPL